MPQDLKLKATDFYAFKAPTIVRATDVVVSGNRMVITMPSSSLVNGTTLEPKEFLLAAALQIVTFAGYQECVNGESMMPMWVFAVLQLLVLMYLCVKLLKEAKVVDLCVRKNWNI